MKALFTINRFSFSKTGNVICVDTDKGQYLISKDKFEKWVDSRELRYDCYYTMDWEHYYSAYAETDLYDYLIIRAGESIFDDIKKGIDKCLH